MWGREPQPLCVTCAVLAQSGGCVRNRPRKAGRGLWEGLRQEAGPGPAVPMRGPQPRGQGTLWDRCRWLSPRPTAAATLAGKLSATRGGESSGPPGGRPGLPSPPNKPRPASWLETTRFPYITAHELARDGRTDVPANSSGKPAAWVRSDEGEPRARDTARHKEALYVSRGEGQFATRARGPRTRASPTAALRPRRQR